MAGFTPFYTFPHGRAPKLLIRNNIRNNAACDSLTRAIPYNNRSTYQSTPRPQVGWKHPEQPPKATYHASDRAVGRGPSSGANIYQSRHTHLFVRSSCQMRQKESFARAEKASSFEDTDEFLSSDPDYKFSSATILTKWETKAQEGEHERRKTKWKTHIVRPGSPSRRPPGRNSLLPKSGIKAFDRKCEEPSKEPDTNISLPSPSSRTPSSRASKIHVCEKVSSKSTVEILPDTKISYGKLGTRTSRLSRYILDHVSGRAESPVLVWLSKVDTFDAPVKRGAVVDGEFDWFKRRTEGAQTSKPEKVSTQGECYQQIPEGEGCRESSRETYGALTEMGLPYRIVPSRKQRKVDRKSGKSKPD